MAINFGLNRTTINNNVNALNLQKNDILDLTKKNPGLKKVILGAGWDVATSGQDFDLDIAAFLLNSNNKVAHIPEDVIFFNNMEGQGIRLEGDNRTGAGEGDDERIQIDLSMIRNDVAKIIFVVTIHNAQIKRQTFGMVENSYVKLNGIEMLPDSMKIESLAEAIPLNEEANIDVKMDYRWIDLRARKNLLMFEP